MAVSKEKKETLKVRILSSSFVVLALAIFKPFGLSAWQWMCFFHLLVIWLIGIVVCTLSDCVISCVTKMPPSTERGVSYIIRRNLWFQIINTPLISLALCLYRHFMMSSMEESNILSWSNFFETFIIIAFCSFVIGLYWRFKFRSYYLAAENEEIRRMNEQLQKLQQNGDTQVSLVQECDRKSESTDEIITLKGTTSDIVTLYISNLLYIESVGNYVKVCYLLDEKPRTDMLRATSKQIEEKLKDYSMVVRCHRAFLVNLQQVERIISQSGTLQLQMKHTNEVLPVSRSNMAHVKDVFGRC